MSLKSLKRNLHGLGRRRKSLIGMSPIAKRKSEYESSVAATTKELADCRDAHSKIVRAIEELGYYEEEHEEKQEQFDQKAKKSRIDLEKDIVERSRIRSERMMRRASAEMNLRLLKRRPRRRS